VLGIVEKFSNFLTASKNQREIRKRLKIVEKINEIYSKLNLTPEEILKRSEYFEKALREGAKPMELLPEAFAVAKYATKLLTEGLRVRGAGHKDPVGDDILRRPAHRGYSPL